MHEPATVTATELARALGVDDSTVRLWIRDKRIKPDARTPGGHSRFKPSSVRRLREWFKRLAAA